MNATKIMGFGIAAAVIGRWANNKKALPSAAGVLQVIGALFLISLLDTGKTEPAARGFAWLFFAAVMLSPDSPLTGLAKAENRSATTASSPAQTNADQPLPLLGPKGNTPNVGRNQTQRSQ